MTSYIQVLSSTPETITSSVQIVHDRVAYASISPATNFFAPLPRPLDKSRGFLALTFTSALCQNVANKIKQSDVVKGRRGDGKTADNNEGSSSTGGSAGHRRYLHEICLKIQPCDVVLHSPLLVSLAKIINVDPLAKLYTTLKPSEKEAPSSTSKESSPALNLFTSQLPLVYVTASSLRIFMPLEEKSEDDGDKKPSSSWPFLPPPVRHDLMMFQIGDVGLVPQADNPLPRMVLDADLFNRAVRRGKLGVPGSEVEDRQYQLDLSGINLSTGCWVDFRSISRPTRYSSDGLAAAECDQQNPAVEWNKLEAKDAENLGEGLKMHDDDDEKESVAKVVPIATSFDLRIVAAPAVAVECFDEQPGADCTVPSLPPPPPPPSSRLVCGHSLEINATSDVDLFLGQHQLDLALDFLGVMLKSICDFSDVLSEVDSAQQQQQPAASSRVRSAAHGGPDLVADSGIDSDVLSNYKHHEGGEKERKRKRCDVSLFKAPGADDCPPPPPSLPLPLPPQRLPRADSARDFVPFDVLLTANKICFHAYEYSPREAKEKKKAEVVDDPYDADLSSDNKSTMTLSRSPRVENFRQYQEHVLSPSSSSASLPPSSYGFVLTPILNVNFAQPHTLVSCSPERQRIELSCFDASLRGSDPSRVVDNDDQLLPYESDYELPWIETKQVMNERDAVICILQSSRASRILS